MSGSVILKNVLVGVLPRLDAALVILSSKPLKVAVTVMTTNGVPLSVYKDKFFFGQDRFDDLGSELKKDGLVIS